MLLLRLSTTKSLRSPLLSKTVARCFVGRREVTRVRCRSSFSSPSSELNNTAVAATTTSTSNNNVLDMDDLWRKHMDLPAQEFAMGCSFLHQIALGNQNEIQQMLYGHPNLVNFRDYDQRTALHIASSEGHIVICQYLIDHGAHINRSDRWGNSPLDDAHRHRHTDVYKYLRLKGAVFGSPSQANNFITAASEGDIDEIRALLEYGNIDINKGDYDKRTGTLRR